MTEDQIALIQTSWAQVVPISDIAARLFYDRLFQVAPQVRPLFKGDMDEQRRMLMTMIGLVVKGLPKLAAIVPKIEALGRRHAAYGATPEHYAVVGDALLWTLRQGLGDAFTAEHEAAWAAAYGVLAATMIAAAEQEMAA
jgi:hemoglobin-like flavoprotein